MKNAPMITRPNMISAVYPDSLSTFKKHVAVNVLTRAQAAKIKQWQQLSEGNVLQELTPLEIATQTKASQKITKNERRLRAEESRKSLVKTSNPID